jgi:hypothetical protein
VRKQEITCVGVCIGECAVLLSGLRVQRYSEGAWSAESRLYIATFCQVKSHAESISERQCRHLSESIQQWGRGVGSVVVDENVPLSVQVQQGVCDTIHTRLC